MKPSIFRKNLILIISVVCLTTLAFIAIAIGLTDRLSVESSSSVLSRTAGLAAASLRDMVDASGFAAGQSSKAGLDAGIAKIAGISGYRVTV
ncbi:MAG TPA: hypothetical protein VN437_05180, partial [Rectinemataceae bacterium]|nr:hypothetical protein [Rectinemataceae bacterium]